MKPIRLEIKGLNSFIERQIIDFEKLTERGLFGIFGPTGSGKSTVLDGITLALYGEIARKSSNYINTNCDNVYVSFEFQISDKDVKRYKVDREFRRDKNTNGIRNKSSKIIDITGGLEEVLEDKSKAVTAKCEEIIGLKLDDFMRTVVIPQGKFSEFLKLEGKERRNMLERLFNLRKYGDDLSLKLNSEIRKEKDKMNVLEGQLKGYEGISEEILKEKTEVIKELGLKIKNEEKELKNIRKEFEKAESIWNTQLEFNEQKEIEESLLSESEKINQEKFRLDAGEKAEKVAVFIEAFEEIIEGLKVEEERIEKLKGQLVELEISKNQCFERFEYAKKEREEVLPSLYLKRDKLNEAEKEKKVLGEIIREGKESNIKCIKIASEIEDKNITLKEYESKETKIFMDLKENENKIESLFVEEIFKEKINDGLFILKDFEGLKEQKEKLEKERLDITTYIKENTLKKEKLKTDLDLKEKKLKKENEILETLIKECPGDQNKILELQSKVSKYKEGLNRYVDIKNNLKSSKNKKTKYEEKLKQWNNNKLSLEAELKELKDYVKKVEVEELAYRLREKLVQEEPCPVCGATHHELDNVEKINLELSNEKRELLESKEIKLRTLTIEFSKLENSFDIECTRFDELNNDLLNLGDFSGEELKKLEEEFDLLKSSLEKYNENKIVLESNIEKLKEEKHLLEQNFNKCEIILCEKIVKNVELKDKLKDIVNKFNSKKCNLEEIKDSLNILDIKAESDKISKQEKEKVALERAVKIARGDLEKLTKLKEALRKEVEKLNEEKGKEEALRESKREVYKEKVRWIKSNLKGIISENESIEKLDFSGLIIEVEKEISNIEKKYFECEKLKEEIEKKYLDVNQQVLVCSENIKTLMGRESKAKERLNNSLQEENFKSLEEAKNSRITKGEMVNIKKIVDKYDNNLIKVRGNIELLTKKLDGKSLNEEEWNDIKLRKENKEFSLTELQEGKVRLNTELENIKSKLEEQREVLEIKAKQEHKLALLSDLEKLFKGKRFVEFIAVNQLKYISIEASKKLKDITNGVYGLEVDENGKFIIRDYKNGGAERDASTLSGGETFLASLALALALSSQIQLKGTAPLELFFLDEGFGTLDDNLLDIVMGSLERLHHDRLSVGIISHVESIKNRVPVRLILTPAESGKGGSKVKIERS